MLLNCRIYDAVGNSFSFSLTTVWSKWFWLSQILWWILTSIEWTFSNNLSSLFLSFVDGINVLDNVNMLLNCHIFNPVVNSLILQIDKSVKKMFLIIQDSVMNSHIYWLDVFLQIKLSVAVSRRWIKCFRRCKHAIELPHWLFSSQ